MGRRVWYIEVGRCRCWGTDWNQNGSSTNVSCYPSENTLALDRDTPFARPPRPLKTKVWSTGGVGEAPTSFYYGPSSDWILRRSPNLFRRAHKTLDAINNRRMRKAWVYKPSQ